MAASTPSSEPARRQAGLVPDAPTVAIEAYGELRDRMVALLAQIDETAAALPVPACPAWTVTDAVAHLTGVCVDVTEGTLGSDVGTTAWADGHVERFAPLGLAGILERWVATGPAIDALAGRMPARMASQFTFDAVTHEHDVMGALGLVAARSSSAVAVGLGFLESSLDRMVRARNLPALALDFGDLVVQVGEGPAAVRVEASRFEVLRSFGGRRSRDQIRALAWTGDPEPYLAIFNGSPLDPPVDPLVE